MQQLLGVAMRNDTVKTYRNENIIYIAPSNNTLKQTNEELADAHAAEMAAGMRLQACDHPSADGSLTFYGTKNEPDPDLLVLSGINPFTQKQWALWEKLNKRDLLLQCPSIVETVIDAPAHEYAACFEYYAGSYDQLCRELRVLVKKLYGMDVE